MDYKQGASKYNYVPGLLAVDTMGYTNIEGRMLIIVAGLDNMRRNFPSLRAFLPSECQWIVHF
jgi:hypothetical protein